MSVWTKAVCRPTDRQIIIATPRAATAAKARTANYKNGLKLLQLPDIRELKRSQPEQLVVSCC